MTVDLTLNTVTCLFTIQVVADQSCRPAYIRVRTMRRGHRYIAGLSKSWPGHVYAKSSRHKLLASLKLDIREDSYNEDGCNERQE